MPIDNRTARKNHVPRVFGNGEWQFFPCNQIGADRVTPAHMTPQIAVGIILVEQMIFALKPYEAVRIVDPVFLGREVIKRAKVVAHLIVFL